MARLATASLLLVCVGCDTEQGGEAAGPATTQSTTEGAPAHKPLGFKVDETLLGPPRTLAGFGVTIRPPIGWVALPQAQVDAVGAALAQQAAEAQAQSTTQPTTQSATQPTTQPATEPSTQSASTVDLGVEPLAVYRNAENGSLLLISSVTLPRSAEEGYAVAMQERFGEVKTGQFTVNGLLVRQYLVMPADQVNFKLLLAPIAGEPATTQASSASTRPTTQPTTSPTTVPGRRLQLDYIVPQAVWPEQVRAVESSIGSLRPVEEAPGEAG